MKKKIVKAISLGLVSATVLAFSGCGTKNEVETVSEAKKEPSIQWRVDTTGKYLNDSSVNSVIAVRCTEGHEASVMLFEKSVIGDKNIWTETLECYAYIGKEGLGKTKEGDNKTPVGDFGITTAFGIKPNPGTALPYIDVTDDIYCCGDKEAYNQMIDIRELPHKCEGEHLIEYTPEYNYGFFIDYNKEGEVGKGSAIFFHCRGANTYTGGCVAVSEENMVKILNAIDSNTRIIIDYLPE